MAPEQARGRSDDPRPAGDQYSLGVVLYEMLTGRPPFTGPAARVLAAVLTQAPPSLRERVPGVPRDLETICLKCLAKRPQERYRSCGELASELRRWLDGEPIRARRLGLGERFVRWCRREPLTMVAVGVTALAMLLAGVLPVIMAVRLVRTIDDEREAEAWSLAEAESACDLAARSEPSRLKALDAAKRARTAIAATKKADADVLALKKQADAEAERAQLVVERARRGSERVDRYRYVADMNLAARAADDGDWQELRARLDSWTAHLRGFDHRGFEWYYLRRSLALRPHSLDGVQRAWGRRLRFRLVAPVRSLAVAGDPPRLVLPQVVKDLETASKLDSHTKAFALVDPVTGKMCATSPLQSQPVLFVATAGGRLVTAAADGTVKLWRPAPLAEERSLEGPAVEPSALACSRDGSLVVVGRSDGSLQAWEAVTGKRRFDLRTGAAKVTAVVVTPNGKQVLVGDGKGRVRRLASDSGKEVGELRGQTGPVLALVVAALPDQVPPLSKQRLASGGDDGTVRLWSLEAGQEDPVAVLKAHEGPVRALAFSPNGRTLASGGNGAVRLWDPITAEELMSLPGQEDAVKALVFTPKGDGLLSAGAAGSIRCWSAAR
jgi:hypothetical protein